MSHTHTHTHTHNGILCSHEKNKIIPFATTWMDLELNILNEVRQRKTNILWYHLYVESRIGHKKTYLQNRNRLTDIGNSLVVATGERGWERGGLGV